MWTALIFSGTAALEAPEVEEVLYAALAKGADRAVKLGTDLPQMGTVAAARAFASFLAGWGPGPSTPALIMSGSQASDDLEGELAPYVAEALQLPYVGVVSGLTLVEGENRAIALKEFTGGIRGHCLP